MTLHLNSDGTPAGTFVQTEEGSIIQDIRELTLVIGVDQTAEIELVLHPRPAQIDVDVKRVRITHECPACGERQYHSCER